MSSLFPIEPFFHTRRPDHCLDVRDDGARETELFGTQELGLAQLLQRPGVPEEAMKGVLGGVWAPAGRSGVYVIREEHRSEAPVEKVRWCVVAGIDVASDRFRPVVSASRAAVDITAEHLRRSGVDPTGVVALYRDEEHRIETLYEGIEKMPPMVEVDGPDHIREKVWCFDGVEGDAAIRVLEECGGAIVGDLTLYRALLRVRDHPMVGANTRPVVRFYNQRDFGVNFASTVRAYRLPVEVDINAWVRQLHQLYDVEEFAEPAPASQQSQTLLDRLRNEAITRRATALVVRDQSTVFLIRSQSTSASLIGHENPPEVADDYDVEWIEKGILRKLAPTVDAELVRVCTDLEQSRSLLESSGADVAFLLNPPPKRQIPALVANGWRLPAHSLQMVPPVPRGLLLAPLQPAHDHVRF